MKLWICLLRQNGEVRLFWKVFDLHRIAHPGAPWRVIQLGFHRFSLRIPVGHVVGVGIVHAVFGRNSLLLLDPRHDGFRFHSVFSDLVIADNGIHHKPDNERGDRAEQNVFQHNISIPPQGVLTGCVRMVHPDYAHNPYCKTITLKHIRFSFSRFKDEIIMNNRCNLTSREQEVPHFLSGGMKRTVHKTVICDNNLYRAETMYANDLIIWRWVTDFHIVVLERSILYFNPI